MSQNSVPVTEFDQMTLSPDVFSALEKVGYNTPTPIQALTIPHLIQGKDVLGQARTGTGKTAAFALPLLSRIDVDNKRPQVLILTPTRELAIQVAESFKSYGAKMKGLNVLPIYGGQSYGVQLNQLRRGVHVVVGTPGRLMDHMRKKTVSFSDLFSLVLDEADEMLHMGFIDDVEWILDRIPKNTQTALFSATMPKPIQRISRKYLTDPKDIYVRPDNKELTTIRQHYWMVKGAPKRHALARILEGADHDGVIVFTKTKAATLDITKSLEDKGFKAEALNGDLAQNAREQTIHRLKSGRIDILVATDVAARGLDVDRISHVINYDMPPKVEPYVHRIGRTGRAGRTGEAILFVNRNERWMLKNIERVTKQTVKEIFLPSNKDINKKRVENFKQRITDTIASRDLRLFKDMIETYAEEQDVSMIEVAAALAKMAHGKTPLLLPNKTAQNSRPDNKVAKVRIKPSQKTTLSKKEAVKRETVVSPRSKSISPHSKPIMMPRAPKRKDTNILPLKKGMERYRIEVGHCHGLRAKDIVGAISNEAGLDGKHIGNININKDFSLVDLPLGMPKDIFSLLKKTYIRSRQMEISKSA